MKRENVICYSL